MPTIYWIVGITAGLSFAVAFSTTTYTYAASLVGISTTTITVSICGDSIVNAGEECDVPGETGTYSTTIAGRQCNTMCLYGPYCGDSILQTIHGEECDDGNNTDDDFCSATCLEETSEEGQGTGGGGGGSGSSGGSNTPLGDTQVTVEGLAYPNTTVNILIDGDPVGSVRTNSSGEFLFTTDTDPGTASLSFWANDTQGTRSLTFTTTFDITQGAVTNVSGILLPPTIRVNTTEVDPGAIVVVSGQAAPNADVEVHIDNSSLILETTSNNQGSWQIDFDTSQVSVATHILKARYSVGSGSLTSDSSFGSSLSLFVGVEGQATSNADLNRDGSVDLIDFSILVFWWGTTGGNSSPPADINQNGNVGLEDFSILLFNWTG